MNNNNNNNNSVSLQEIINLHESSNSNIDSLFNQWNEDIRYIKFHEVTIVVNNNDNSEKGKYLFLSI